MPDSPGLLTRLGARLRGTGSNAVSVTHGGRLSDAEAALIAHAIVTSRPGDDIAGWTSAVHRLDIWGPTFRAFMGMSDSGGGGVDEIQDDPASWGRARIAEPYVFRAQDVRAKAIASVPLRCWQLDRNGRRQPVEHVAIDILNRSVPMNPGYDAYVSGMGTLMRYTLLSLDTHGRCAWQLGFSNPDAKGRRVPTEIYWMVPSAFTPVHGYEVGQPVPFAGVNYMTGGKRQFLTADQVVYFSTDNPNDPIIGTSKVSVLRNAINLRLYSVKSNADFFKNSMRPDWILSGDWKNTAENVDSIKRSLRRHYTGESNREPLVIGEGATAHLLTTAQKDAEWSSMMRMVGEEIMAVYGVPVIFLNNFERATYENAKQARLMLWHETMIQETRDLAAMITRRYLWRFWPETYDQRLEIAFDYGAVEGLTEDVGLLWERTKGFRESLQKDIEKRILTPNQARQVLTQVVEAMGLDSTPFQGDLPDGQGDVVFVKWDDVPADQSSVQAMMNINAARSANPLTGYLIENIPGAPRAGNNAERGVGELQAAQDRLAQLQADARAQAARQQPQQPSQPPQQRSHRPVITKARPAPGPIRDNRLAPVQKRLSAKLKRHFQDTQREALRNLRKSKSVALKAPTDDLYDRQAAKGALAAIIRLGVTESAQQAYAASAEDFELSVSFDAEAEWVDRYMGKRLRLIHGIDDTTAEALSDTLTEGAAAGETIDQLAARVTDVFSNAIDNRSETIARTETLQAYASASLSSYKEAGLEQAEIFDGSDDPECAAVDGQVVSLEEADALMADEHPNGTRGVAPVVNLDSGDDIQAASFQFDRFGRLVLTA